MKGAGFARPSRRRPVRRLSAPRPRPNVPAGSAREPAGWPGIPDQAIVPVPTTIRRYLPSGENWKVRKRSWCCESRTRRRRQVGRRGGANWRPECDSIPAAPARPRPAHGRANQSRARESSPLRRRQPGRPTQVDQLPRASRRACWASSLARPRRWRDPPPPAAPPRRASRTRATPPWPPKGEDDDQQRQRRRRPPTAPATTSSECPDRTGAHRLAGLKPSQVFRQRRGIGVAISRLLPQALQAYGFQVPRRPRLQWPRGCGIVTDDLHEGIDGRGAFERRPAGQHFVQDRPQGVNVGRRADFARLAGGLFGGM